VKHSITYSKDNKLKDYIDYEGKAKELPISYSTFDKTFLSLLIDSKLILLTPLDYKSDEGHNPREIQISQITTLLNIIAEEIYLDKFDTDIGVFRIETKISAGNDSDIKDDHLIAYRMSKEEIVYNWLLYLIKVIESYFNNTGKIYDNKKLLQVPFTEQLWSNIRTFIKNLKNLPLWKDRSMAATIFSHKNNYDYWAKIFETTKSPEGVQVLAKPLNYIEMIKNTD